VGINSYHRTDGFAPDAGEVYWSKTADYWAGVRGKWTALIETGAPVRSEGLRRGSAACRGGHGNAGTPLSTRGAPQPNRRRPCQRLKPNGGSALDKRGSHTAESVARRKTSLLSGPTVDATDVPISTGRPSATQRIEIRQAGNADDDAADTAEHVDDDGRVDHVPGRAMDECVTGDHGRYGEDSECDEA